MTSILLLLLLSDPDPAALEQSGPLWQAGAAWQDEGSVEGQARVICRMLEEALYAGHSNRASWLIEELESLSPEPGLVEYWRGRLAWTCGLDSTALALLAAVEGSRWIEHRAAGTACVYTGRPDEAVREFEQALSSAETVRREFWAGVDLCFACIQAGDLDDATEVCAILEGTWPYEGLPPILRALILRQAGRETEAEAVLQALLASGDPAIADMAGVLLEEGR